MLVWGRKGGVGKSTVALALAIEAARDGNRVGVLDLDLAAPSLPQLAGAVGRDVVQGETSGWTPVPHPTVSGLALMSIGFMMPPGRGAGIWSASATQRTSSRCCNRGRARCSHAHTLTLGRNEWPSASLPPLPSTGLTAQLVRDVNWGDLDLLLVDMGPGVSEVHRCAAETLELRSGDGALLVTDGSVQGDACALHDAALCELLGIGVLGVLRNGCPEGSAALATDRAGPPLLGAIPYSGGVHRGGGAPSLAGLESAREAIDAVLGSAARARSSSNASGGPLPPDTSDGSAAAARPKARPKRRGSAGTPVEL